MRLRWAQSRHSRAWWQLCGMLDGGFGSLPKSPSPRIAVPMWGHNCYHLRDMRVFLLCTLYSVEGLKVPMLGRVETTTRITCLANFTRPRCVLPVSCLVSSSFRVKPAYSGEWNGFPCQIPHGLLSLFLCPRGVIWGTGYINPSPVSINVRDRGFPSSSSSTLVTAPAGSVCSATITFPP